MTDTARRVKTPLYKVSLVEKTQPLVGSGQQIWHRYVLENGRSTIVGQRRGKLKEVTAYATHYAEQLNARSTNSQSIMTPRGRRPAQAGKTAPSPK